LSEVECTCLAEKERQETARTGFVKLVHFEEGFDEDGNPCPLHDPGKRKDVSEEPTPADVRKERGEQLRALVVSWNDDSTFVDALKKQQGEIDAGTLTLNPEWEQVADEILGGYMTVQAQLTAWDEAKKKEEDTGPKLILP